MCDKPPHHTALCLVAVITLSALGGGCATPGPTIVSSSEARTRFDAFAKGDVRLQCYTGGCAWEYGGRRLRLTEMYLQNRWHELALLAMETGYHGEQPYFYLGRAAEELSYPQAAEIYYRLSLASSRKCSEPLNICDGLDLPRQTLARLATLAEKKTQNVSSPAVASVATPTNASEPAKIAPSRKVETASAGPNVGVCRETGRTDTVEWSEAKKANTVVAYRRYIDVCNPAKYLPEAVDAIARLQQDAQRADAKQRGNREPARATLDSASPPSKEPMGTVGQEAKKTVLQLDAPSVLIADPRASEVKLRKKGGVYEVPVILNGVLTIHMIMDSGAGDLSITEDVFYTLARTGTVRENDILEPGTYRLADGSRREKARLRLQSVRIGAREIKNVTCSISTALEGPLLLGQSALEKLGKYSIDYSKGALILY